MFLGMCRVFIYVFNIHMNLYFESYEFIFIFYLFELCMTIIVQVWQCCVRYVSYVWEGIKQRWMSRNNLGLFKLIKGFFASFMESFFMVKMDIRDGCLYK